MNVRVEGRSEVEDFREYKLGFAVFFFFLGGGGL